VLTWRRWGLFFIFLAVLNEVVWRMFDTDTWVAFKVWAPCRSPSSSRWRSCRCYSEIRARPGRQGRPDFRRWTPCP